ncbi:MAG: hypothetical protein IKY00_03390, partial [Clostridia bacterium]|nr:hypothetical protein [Clostridia bacterium]
ALHGSEFSNPTKKESQEIGIIMQGVAGWEKAKKTKRFGQFGVQRYWRKIDDGSWITECEEIDDILPY